MAGERQRQALQTIFSFFLGLMVVAFIGVGVNTFYPSPAQQQEQELQQLYRQQENLNRATGGKTLTAEQQLEFDRIQDRIDELQQKQQLDMEVWSRNTSIVLVIFATIVMGVSLIRSEQLQVLSNGLLLGGLFSMVYGAGWTIFSGTSTARFFVVAFALIVTIALGYAKFVRERKKTTVSVESSAVGTPVAGLADLEGRVAMLEARTAAAASALSQDVTSKV